MKESGNKTISLTQVKGSAESQYDRLQRLDSSQGA